MLFEPSVLWSAFGNGAPPDFDRDRDVVYAPHIYTGGFTNGPISRAAFAIARLEARALRRGARALRGVGHRSTPRRQAGDRYFVRHQALQDSFRVSATLWTWRESCGDPHKIADMRQGVAVPQVWGVFQVDCRTNRITRLRRALIRDLTRAYVRAAPGRLAGTRYTSTGALVASGRATRRDGPLVAFLPLSRPSPAGGRDQYLPANCVSVRACLRIRTRGLRGPEAGPRAGQVALRGRAPQRRPVVAQGGVRR